MHITKNQNFLKISAFITILCGLFSKNFEFFLNPQPLFDDGNPLFADSLCLGIKSIFLPYAGNLLLAIRLVFWAALNISLTHFFSIILAINFVLISWILSLFTSDSYAWLVPSVKWRVVIIFLIAFGCGTLEIHQIASSLVYTLGTCIMLFLLQEDFKLNILKYLLVLFVIFSSPLSGSFVILAIARYISSRNKHFLFFGLTIFLSTIVNITLTVFESNSVVQSKSSNLAELFFGIYDRIFTYSVFIPLYGQYITNWVLSDICLYSLASIIFIALLNRLKNKFSKLSPEILSVFFGLLGSLTLFYLMHMLSRSYSNSPFEIGYANIYSRFSYFGYQIGLICAAIMLSRMQSGFLKSLILIWLTSINLFTATQATRGKVFSCAAETREFLKELNDALILQKTGQLSGDITTRPLLSGPTSTEIGKYCTPKGVFNYFRVTVTKDEIRCELN